MAGCRVNPPPPVRRRFIADPNNIANDFFPAIIDVIRRVATTTVVTFIFIDIGASGLCGGGSNEKSPQLFAHDIRELPPRVHQPLRGVDAARATQWTTTPIACSNLPAI